MSEYINNKRQKVDQLKSLILELHKGKSTEEVKSKLKTLMGEVPYGDVVTAEDELIAEGLPQEEVLKFCDIHTEALRGQIDTSTEKDFPAGHPVHSFKKENRELENEIIIIKNIFDEISESDDDKDVSNLFEKIRIHFNALMDVEKHYQRKENLLFPFLEKYKITGPPMVMWGKHDQTRTLLKTSIEVLSATGNVTAGEAKIAIEISIKPSINALEEMIYKEEKILFPMCLDTLTEADWYEIYIQSDEIGFCLYEPKDKWTTEGKNENDVYNVETGKVQLPSGSFTFQELTAVFNTLPVDLTFVDNEDTVRFFTQGKERIFQRNKTIIGRKVQFCHPPSSVHVVEQILNDFKSGKQESAAFWINMHGKFIHIAYYAVRGEEKEYLGTLEVSQDITGLRALEGERRILEYDNN